VIYRFIQIIAMSAITMVERGRKVVQWLIEVFSTTKVVQRGWEMINWAIKIWGECKESDWGREVVQCLGKSTRELNLERIKIKFSEGGRKEINGFVELIR
jgi:hypothetical protein